MGTGATITTPRLAEKFAQGSTFIPGGTATTLFLSNNDSFGISVALNGAGDRLAVGSLADIGGVNRGAVHLINMPTILPPTLYADNPTVTQTIALSVLRNALESGASITLQANNDITWNAGADLLVNNTGGNGGGLTLTAGRSLLLNSNITTDNGDLTLIGNDVLSNGVIDAERDAGSAVITMASGTTLNAGTGNILLELADGAGKTNSTAGDVTLASMSANTIEAKNKGSTGVAPSLGRDLL